MTSLYPWIIRLKAWCTIFLFSAIFWQANAQIADSLQLEEIVIEASHIAIPWLFQPVNASVVDPVLISKSSKTSLASILTSFSSAHIRSYTGGGLSSVSVRGFDSRQTQFVWNGFTMNHSMIGTTDFGLYPAYMMDNIRVVTGNNSATFGSGSVAGTILTDSPKTGNQTSISFNQGSWGNFGSSIRSGIKTDTYYAGVVLGSGQAVNNYPYFDQIRQREATRKNNQMENRHALISAGLSIQDFQFNTSVWLGYHNYHVPGSVTVANSQAVQTDQFVNLYQQIGYSSNLGFTELSGLLQNYDLDYIDPRNRINSESTLQRRQARLKHQTRLHETLFFTAISEAGFSSVKTNNYSDTSNRNQFATSASLEYVPLSFIRLYPSLRFDSYSDFGNNVSGAIGVNVSTPVSWLTLRSQFSNNFSAPTLNDLYWSPGGNPDLQPERSTTFEVGLNAEKRFDFAHLRFSATGFSAEFENGIRWFPGQGGVWSPTNINEMKSRGLELEFHGNIILGDFNIRPFLSYTLTDATSMQTSSQTGEQLRKQVANVPRTGLKLGGLATWRFVYVSANWHSVSERFTTDDHSSPLDPLDPYKVLDIHGGVNFEFSSFTATMGYSLLNALDAEYEVISWYPMPPRNYSINLTLTFKY